MADPLSTADSAAAPAEADDEDERPSQLIASSDTQPAAESPAQMASVPLTSTTPEATAPPAPPAAAAPAPPSAPSTPHAAGTTTLPGGEDVQAAVALGDDPLVASILAAKSFDELATALKPMDSWEFVRRAPHAPAAPSTRAVRV